MRMAAALAAVVLGPTLMYIISRRGPRLSAGGGSAGFDTSEYRQATYGAPTHYCDCTRALASNGAGTLGDPWNLTQAAANAVAGNVVGFLPVGGGTPVDLPTTNNDNVPAFNPAASGTAGSRIVFVTKYAATWLVARDGRATIATNADRAEIRHDGVAPTIVAGIGAGNGCAAYGSNSRSYVTYDGFFTDMAEAYMKEDSGVIRVELCTGVHVRNFVIKGANLTVASNPVIYRPQGATDTILSNFLAYDFDNDGTGSDTPQDALFSDQYGDVNFLIEHFDIDNTERGPFLKGSDVEGRLNYGTIQYGIIRNLLQGMRFNALHATNVTTVRHCLIHTFARAGLMLSGETIDVRNLTVDHVTVAKGDTADVNQEGAVVCKPIGTNITIRDCLFDLNAGGTFGHMVNCGEATTVPDVLDFLGHYENGSAESWTLNATQYNTLAAWRTATSREANSQVLASSPFVDRTNNDFHVTGGHAAKTASSTGGEIGCYGGTTETIGVVS